MPGLNLEPPCRTYSKISVQTNETGVLNKKVSNKLEEIQVRTLERKEKTSQNTITQVNTSNNIISNNINSNINNNNNTNMRITKQTKYHYDINKSNVKKSDSSTCHQRLLQVSQHEDNEIEDGESERQNKTLTDQQHQNLKNAVKRQSKTSSSDEKINARSINSDHSNHTQHSNHVKTVLLSLANNTGKNNNTRHRNHSIKDKIMRTFSKDKNKDLKLAVHKSVDHLNEIGLESPSAPETLPRKNLKLKKRHQYVNNSHGDSSSNKSINISQPILINTRKSSPENISINLIDMHTPILSQEEEEPSTRSKSLQLTSILKTKLKSLDNGCNNLILQSGETNQSFINTSVENSISHLDQHGSENIKEKILEKSTC